MTDYRALCAELVSNLQLIVSYLESDECGTSDSEELIDRAHTLLAQPEAESPATQLAARPLLEKVARMGDQAAAWLEANPPGQLVAIEPRGCPTPGACSCVELVAQPEPEGLTEIALQMLGTIESMELIIPEITDTIRKALEQGNPTPQPPAEGEVAVAASLIELRSTVMALGQMGMHVAAQRVERAADLLQRLAEWKASALAVEREWDANDLATMLGCQLGESQRACIQREVPRLLARLRELEHPQPVAVSERLPCLEDCDEEGRCWFHSVGRTWRDWYLLKASSASETETHWLPFNALPLTQGNEEAKP